MADISINRRNSLQAVFQTAHSQSSCEDSSMSRSSTPSSNSIAVPRFVGATQILQTGRVLRQNSLEILESNIVPVRLRCKSSAHANHLEQILVTLQVAVVRITQRLVAIKKEQSNAEQSLTRELLPRQEFTGSSQALRQLQMLQKQTLDIIFNVLEQQQMEIERVRQQCEKLVIQWQATGLGIHNSVASVINLTGGIIQDQMKINQARLHDAMAYQQNLRRLFNDALHLNHCRSAVTLGKDVDMPVPRVPPPRPPVPAAIITPLASSPTVAAPAFAALQQHMQGCPTPNAQEAPSTKHVVPIKRRQSDANRGMPARPKFAFSYLQEEFMKAIAAARQRIVLSEESDDVSLQLLKLLQSALVPADAQILQFILSMLMGEAAAPKTALKTTTHSPSSGNKSGAVSSASTFSAGDESPITPPSPTVTEIIDDVELNNLMASCQRTRRCGVERYNAPAPLPPPTCAAAKNACADLAYWSRSRAVQAAVAHAISTALNVESKQGLCVPPTSCFNKGSMPSLARSTAAAGTVQDASSLHVIHTGIKVMWRHAQLGSALVRHVIECENILEFQPVSPAGVCALLISVASASPNVPAASSVPTTEVRYDTCGQLQSPSAATLSSPMTNAALHPVRPGNESKETQQSRLCPLPSLAPLPPLRTALNATTVSLDSAATLSVLQESKVAHPNRSPTARTADVPDQRSAWGKGARPPVNRFEHPTPMPGPKSIRAGGERRCSVITTSRRVQAEQAAAAPVLQRDPELKVRSIPNAAVSEKTTGGCCAACNFAATAFQKWVLSVCGKNRISLAVTQTIMYLLCTVPDKHHLLPEVAGSLDNDASLAERLMGFTAFGKKVRCVSAWKAALTCLKHLDLKSRHFAIKEMNSLMFGSDETKDHNAAALKRVDNWRGLLLDGSVRCVGADSVLVKETWALTLSIFTMFHGRLFHAEERTKHFEQELLRSLLIQDLGCPQHHQDSLSITIQLLSALINHVCGGAKSLPVSFDSVEWHRLLLLCKIVRTAILGLSSASALDDGKATMPRRSIISSLVTAARASVTSRTDLGARRSFAPPLFASLLSELETRLSRESSLLAGLQQLRRLDLQSGLMEQYRKLADNMTKLLNSISLEDTGADSETQAEKAVSTQLREQRSFFEDLTVMLSTLQQDFGLMDSKSLQDIFERIRMSSKPKHREHLQHKINITLDRKRAKTVFK